MTEKEIRDEVERRVAARKIANQINAERGGTVLSEDYNVVLGDLVKELTQVKGGEKYA